MALAHPHAGRTGSKFLLALERAGIGVVILRGERIVTTGGALRTILGRRVDQWPGLPIETALPDAALLAALRSAGGVGPTLVSVGSRMALVAGAGDQNSAVLLFQLAQMPGAQRFHVADPWVFEELEAVLRTVCDGVLVTDGQGTILRYTPSWGQAPTPEELLMMGKSVAELEARRIFYPSATRQVLATGTSQRVLQDTAPGRRLEVVGIPVRDGSNRIVRVVSLIRDITAEEQLRRRLAEIESLAERYRQELARLRSAQAGDGELVFRSERMRQVLAVVDRVAATDSTVLILGETGVGKQLVARRLHQGSSRRDGPFVVVNCSAVPESLLESELFGYEGGAFTGAGRHGKVGLLELAHKGTLLLDEVGELPLHLQAKLLHALQDRRFFRVGGTREVRVDVRIVAATNRDLEELVQEGAFRRDLYYRLNVVPVSIPPLRERPEDIPVLVEHFLRRHSDRYGRHVEFTPAAMEALVRYPWPGNVRELENLVERLFVTVTDPVIDVVHLPDQVRVPARPRRGNVEVHRIVPLREAVEELETKLIAEAMARYGSTRRAARVLGVDQSTLVRRLQKLHHRHDRPQPM
ncbi:sigma-54 interaction domain-containing protein [Caldinitratiruptor microaerophilus]|uniref:HTH-type transcriptional regulatory protein TyrR n=1 Tax=Caldinitratiruptor microaerophilus TaxID=671077 RepID=A0AA35CHI9_9FIRM|nr:sigma 54-interacting transcriptional regulator [Caldinitratiruptor microaerophilus]BDG58987.1 RNA polymerase subunit sigma-54 [Caldinitratiruptor microaerophilus]